MDNKQATCQTSKTSGSWTQPLDFMALTANHRLGPGVRVSHSFCQNGRVKLTSQRPLQIGHPTHLSGLEPREPRLSQSLSYTALGAAGITLLRVPAGKRLTDSFFSCNYLSLRTLRLRSRRFLVRFVSRRVDRWPVSPPQRIAPRRLLRNRLRSRPTRSELRRSRPCAVRSISSIRISSACSTAGPRSPLRSDRSSIIRDWKSGPRPARTR